MQIVPERARVDPEQRRHERQRAPGKAEGPHPPAVRVVLTSRSRPLATKPSSS